jgi:hypothetical protein
VELVRPAVVGFIMAGVASAAAGCFDVHRADPGVLLLDNFDDGDALPADRQFGVWLCQTYNPSNQDYSCGLDAGYNSPYSLALKFTLVDPPDGQQQFGGAMAFTQTIDPQDFSGFDNLVFSGVLASGIPAPPKDAFFQIVLQCDGAQADDYSYPGNLNLEQIVAVDKIWRTYSVPLEAFTPASYLPLHPLGGPAACLRQVNAIQFEVPLELGDGQSAMGQLNIDNIYFQ